MTEAIQEATCRPDQFPTCCHQAGLTDGRGDHQHYPYLGSMVLHMEETHDADGLDLMRSLFGYPDAIAARNFISRHPEWQLDAATIERCHAEQPRLFASRNNHPGERAMCAISQGQIQATFDYNLKVNTERQGDNWSAHAQGLSVTVYAETAPAARERLERAIRFLTETAVGQSQNAAARWRQNLDARGIEYTYTEGPAPQLQPSPYPNGLALRVQLALYSVPTQES